MSLKSNKRELHLLLLLTIAGCAYKANHNYPKPYLEFKQEVEKKFGIDNLQKWANQTCVEKKIGRYELEVLPRELRQVRGIVAIEICESKNGTKYMLINCGGGFGHWGLVVGSHSFKPDSFNHPNFEEIAPGVWGNWE